MKTSMPTKTNINVKLFLLAIIFLLLSTPIYSQLTGSSMTSPFDQGSFPSIGLYDFYDSRQTNGYGNDFYGEPTEDVFYKFTVEGDADINILLSNLNAPGIVYLFDASGYMIASDYHYPYVNSDCELNLSIPAGTYYIGVEAYYHLPLVNLDYSLSVQLAVN